MLTIVCNFMIGSWLMMIFLFFWIDVGVNYVREAVSNAAGRVTWNMKKSNKIKWTI